MEAELTDVIKLTKDLIEEQKKPAAPPVSEQEASTTKKAHSLARQVKAPDEELGGWRVGDKCRTLWIKDGAKYNAVIAKLVKARKSAVVTFIG